MLVASAVTACAGAAATPPSPPPAPEPAVDEDACLLFAPGYTATIAALDGWELGCGGDGAQGGRLAELRSLVHADVMIYVVRYAWRGARSIADFVTSHNAELVASHPTMRITEAGSAPRRDGKTAPLWEYALSESSAFELSAYAADPGGVTVLSLMTHSSEMLAASKSALEKLVASYAFVTENVTVK
jgi:hypothetical protein